MSEFRSKVFWRFPSTVLFRAEIVLTDAALELLPLRPSINGQSLALRCASNEKSSVFVTIMLAIFALFARFLVAVATVSVDVAASQILGLTKTLPVGVAATSAAALDSLEGVLERKGRSSTVGFGEETYLLSCNNVEWRFLHMAHEMRAFFAHPLA